MLSLPASQRYTFLDICVDAITRTDMDTIVADSIKNGRRLLIGNHNLHSLYLFHQSAMMRSFYAAADRVHVDGISIVWLAKLFGIPLRTEHRTGYLDWLPSMMTVARDRGWRVFYLGSRPGTLEEGLRKLREQYPVCRSRAGTAISTSPCAAWITWMYSRKLLSTSRTC